MSRYRLALSVGTASLIFFFIFVLFLAALQPNPDSLWYQWAQVVGFALSMSVVIPGLFLWMSGFRRYQAYIGTSGLKWVLYASAFTFLAAFVLELRYGKELDAS
tara:strand:+ start:193 stop:504 length:312 start_codon:yes stop_codon:yes gene_type:complete